MAKITEIWAKSDKTSLIQHTRSVLIVFKKLKQFYADAPKRCEEPALWKILFLSLFLHDLGKAAVGFQSSLRNGEQWGYRHEMLSASFVSCLTDLTEIEKTCVALAIMGHHKSLTYIQKRYSTYPPGPGKENYDQRIQELVGNFDKIQSFLSLLPEFSQEYLGKCLNNYTIAQSTDDLMDSYTELVFPNYILKWENGKLTTLHKTLGRYLKGFTTACDHLASGGETKILCGISTSKLYNFSSLRRFQSKASTTTGDAFLIAPTGSGKTEAALFWSEANQNEIYSRRVFYLLPYTASINAMYERLKNDFGDESLVGLLHGKSRYYIYKSLSEEVNNNQAAAYAKRIENLTKQIYRPYKVMTPFQVLKAFFGIKGFEQQLSEMTSGLFILDEIHAYDAHTTTLILEMLKILKSEYGAKIFIMSATLPSFLKNIFTKELGIRNEIFLSEKKLRQFTRHQVKILAGDMLSNLDRIEGNLQSGKRVLIVCNTVKRAQQIYKRLSRATTNRALLHGKFTLRDRKSIESRLSDTQLLVGTQAIEVSLDINYEVLYSEPAPIDALIQRFGRVNRRGWEEKQIAPVYVVNEGSENDRYIYDPKLVQNTLKILSKANLLSESKIQSLVDTVYADGYKDDDAEEFDRVRRHFQALYEENIPFMKHSDSELNFYSLYNSYEVVPMRYKLKYLKKIEEKKYLESMSYFTNISQGQFSKLKKEGRIEKDKGIFFVDVPYSKEEGLLLEECTENII